MGGGEEGVLGLDDENLYQDMLFMVIFCEFSSYLCLRWMGMSVT